MLTERIPRLEYFLYDLRLCDPVQLMLSKQSPNKNVNM